LTSGKKSTILSVYFIAFYLVASVYFNYNTVKPEFIQTPSSFLTFSQFIRNSLENGSKI